MEGKKIRSKSQNLKIENDENNGNKLKNLDYTYLPINKDYYWQEIIKEIFNMDKSFNMDEILKKLNIDPPLSSYIIYHSEKFKENKNNNKSETFKSLEANISKEWKKISKEEKNKYKKASNNSKINYARSIAIINKYLFLGIDFINNNSLSEYNLFLLDETIKIKTIKSLNEINSLTKKRWESNNNIREKYENIKNKILSYINNLKNIKKIEGLDLFIEEKIDNNKKYNLKYIKKQWKLLSEKEKILYNYKAIIKNIKNEILLNIKEIKEGNIKKKNKITPFSLFNSDLRKIFDKNLNLKYILNQWSSLNENLKNLYMQRCCRLNLIIKYKNFILKKKNKKKSSETKKKEKTNYKKNKLNNKINDKNNLRTLKKDERKEIVNNKKNDDSKENNSKENNNEDEEEEEEFINIKSPEQSSDDSDVDYDDIESCDDEDTDENELEREEEMREYIGNTNRNQQKKERRVYTEPEKPLTALDLFLSMQKDVNYKVEFDNLKEATKEQFYERERKNKFLYNYRLIEFKNKGYYDACKSLEEYEKNARESFKKIDQEMNEKLNINSKTGLIKQRKEKNENK